MYSAWMASPWGSSMKRSNTCASSGIVSGQHDDRGSAGIGSVGANHKHNHALSQPSKPAYIYYLVAQPRLLLHGRLHDADGGGHHAEAAGAAGGLGGLEPEGLLGGGAWVIDFIG